MQSLRRDKRGTTCTGSTLIIVALLMAAVATLSLSFLAVLRSTHQESQSSREGLSALRTPNLYVLFFGGFLLFLRQLRD